MTCPVHGLCVGSMAAQAGSHQLLRVLAGSRRLRQGESLLVPAGCAFAVRSGSIKSLTLPGAQARGFHFAGELVGVGKPLRLEALEDSELCALRRDAAVAPGADDRRCAGRLWDMTSRELLRERGLANCLDGQPARRRLLFVLDHLVQRACRTGRCSRGVALRLSPGDLGEYLRLPGGMVEQALSELAERGVLQRWPYQVGMLQPDRLREELLAG
ncbi:MAG: Crp/Fnr family transcriptional regulator [Ramlibacter sp.]